MYGMNVLVVFRPGSGYSDPAVSVHNVSDISYNSAGRVYFVSQNHGREWACKVEDIQEMHIVEAANDLNPFICYIHPTPHGE